jgi:hypothetical protein
VLEGQHFDRVGAVELEDLEVGFAPGRERSDTKLHLAVSVPHGTPPGARALVTETIGYGAATLLGAIEVTYITSAPAGDDDAGDGTHDAPYRSVTKALSLAAAGDTVWLLDGRYDETTGESWPHQPWHATFPPETLPVANVPDGVRVRGESETGVVLAGSFIAGGMPLGLVFAGSGRAERLTMQDFATAVVAFAGDVSLSRLELLENSEGVLVFLDGTVELDTSMVQASYHDGVRVTNDASLRARNVLFDSNLWALTATGDATVELDDVYVVGSDLDGVRFFDASTGLLRSTVVESSALAGVLFGGRDLVLRESVLRGNGEGGVRVVGDPQVVDLGNLLELGDNVFETNVPYQLIDARAAREDLLGVAITVAGTSLQGVVPEAQIAAGPTSDGDRYVIEGTHNIIQFF